MNKYGKYLAFAVAMGAMSGCINAQDGETSPPSLEKAAIVTMTPEKMAKLVRSFAKDAQVQNNVIGFTLQEREVLIVHDVTRNRMRIVSPIAPSGLLDEELLMRMAQANYDSALDARYAVADGLLWSVFIHPLGSLQKEDFISAIAQVVTAAETFGTTYTSGAMIFGGGDSSALHDELLKELEEATSDKGEPI